MVTAITQAKDLKSINLEDLIGSLRAHEVVLQGDKPVNEMRSHWFTCLERISANLISN